MSSWAQAIALVSVFWLAFEFHLTLSKKWDEPEPRDSLEVRKMMASKLDDTPAPPVKGLPSKYWLAAFLLLFVAWTYT